MDEVKKRGFNWLVPIGRMLTQHEEKNDVSRCQRHNVTANADSQSSQADEQTEDDDSEDDSEDGSEGNGGTESEEESSEEDGDEDGEQDLDADMQDMDDPQLNTSVAGTDGGHSDDMDAEESGEFEEGQSSEAW